MQAKIEQEHHKREIRSILGDRRIRSIPDYKSEEVPEREFKLHEIVHKTFKEKVKIEYHQLTYDCYRVGELSAVNKSIINFSKWFLFKSKTVGVFVDIGDFLRGLV